MREITDITRYSADVLDEWRECAGVEKRNFTGFGNRAPLSVESEAGTELN